MKCNEKIWYSVKGEMFDANFTLPSLLAIKKWLHLPEYECIIAISFHEKMECIPTRNDKSVRLLMGNEYICNF